MPGQLITAFWRKQSLVCHSDDPVIRETSPMPIEEDLQIQSR